LERYRQSAQKAGSAFEFLLRIQTTLPGSQEIIVRARAVAIQAALYFTGHAAV
jgi:hypothetical protein